MTDLEIAKQHKMQPIAAIAKKLNIPDEYVEPCSRYTAKVTLPELKPKGKLILVTAINPTPYGEGKTTVSVGLADAFTLSGYNVAVALREPSLGPVFGIKGGATGGGYSQVVPMEDINLHFTGDFHAITSANNLLSALIDNHIKQGNELDIAEVTWRRAMDMNDRALRVIEVAKGGPVNGVPRTDGFNITAASEIMAVLCLSESIDDLKERLGRIIVGYNSKGGIVTAAMLKAQNAMAILLYKALSPNLVQTLGGTPAFIHGGPFANIAHGCNSVLATKTALTLCDYVVTEAGFGAELGAEKFFDIKCRAAGLTPSAVVLVATARALKYNGGADKNEVLTPNTDALKRGLCNLERHIKNLKSFGVPVTVAVNRFSDDTDEELDIILSAAENLGANAYLSTGWADGGKGCVDLMNEVLRLTAAPTPKLRCAYDIIDDVKTKIEKLAVNLYGATDITYSEDAEHTLRAIGGTDYSYLPVCVAKTQYSFSADAKLLGAPLGFTMHVRQIQVRAGAGFLVAVCGDVMLMPGLPKSPNSDRMTIENNGLINGLF